MNNKLWSGVLSSSAREGRKKWGPLVCQIPGCWEWRYSTLTKATCVTDHFLFLLCLVVFTSFISTWSITVKYNFFQQIPEPEDEASREALFKYQWMNNMCSVSVLQIYFRLKQRVERKKRPRFANPGKQVSSCFSVSWIDRTSVSRPTWLAWIPSLSQLNTRTGSVSNIVVI